jgi:hypothetical protein
MSGIEFGEATTEERLWCARLMASSEPWIALGRGEDACRAACVAPDYVILVARRGGTPLGFARLHPRGARGLALPREHRGGRRRALARRSRPPMPRNRAAGGRSPCLTKDESGGASSPIVELQIPGDVGAAMPLTS